MMLKSVVLMEKNRHPAPFHELFGQKEQERVKELIYRAAMTARVSRQD